MVAPPGAVTPVDEVLSRNRFLNQKLLEKAHGGGKAVSFR